jgi:hypothetical protein
MNNAQILNKSEKTTKLFRLRQLAESIEASNIAWVDEYEPERYEALKRKIACTEELCAMCIREFDINIKKYDVSKNIRYFEEAKKYKNLLMKFI